MLDKLGIPPIVAAAVAGLIVAYLVLGLVQIKAWEIALRFTFGKYAGQMGPGLGLYFPVMQKLRRVDMRVYNRDLFQQAVITKDNVTLNVDAVVYFRVTDPEKAILAVEDFEAAVKDRAKVVLRDLIGETPLDEVLAHREQIAAKVKTLVETVIAQWGLHVDLIGLQDIQVPIGMQEVLAKAAIAERERQYVVIKSQADVESAKNFAAAAKTLAASPGAIELRRFELLSNLTQSGTTKVVFDLAKPFDDVHRSAMAVSTSLIDAAGGSTTPAPVSPPPASPAGGGHHHS